MVSSYSRIVRFSWLEYKAVLPLRQLPEDFHLKTGLLKIDGLRQLAALFHALRLYQGT